MLGRKYRISVVIPTRNSENFIENALESVFAQDYVDTEVVVVDDGSTDGTRDRVKAFGNDVILLALTHRGANFARNRGMEAATGEVIQFLDSDDVLVPGKWSRQLELLSKDCASAVFGWYEHRMLEDSEYSREVRPSKGLLHDSIVLAIRHVIQIETPLHWISNVRKISGFDENLVCNQDYDFNLRLACSGIRFVYDEDKSSVNYRRIGSVSYDSRNRHIHMIDVLKKCQDLLEKGGMFTDERRLAMAHSYAMLARSLVGCGESKLAKRVSKYAFICDRSGGLKTVYDAKSLRLRRLFGLIWSERLIKMYRELSRALQQ